MLLPKFYSLWKILPEGFFHASKNFGGRVMVIRKGVEKLDGTDFEISFPMNTLNWTIVGPGNIAEAFLNDLRRVKLCKNNVIGVMSNKREEAVAFGRKHKIKDCFDDLSEMLKVLRPDVVYIASPHSAHFREAMTCIHYGCPILCEKPLTINGSQAIELIETARSYNVFLMEGMWIRFLPSILKVRQLLEEETIGKVTSVIADMSYIAPKKSYSRFYDPQLGGGSLLDLGIYPVYLSLLVLGIPQEIRAVARLTQKQIDMHCNILFRYSKKRFALLESSIVEDTGRTATIYGSKGKLVLLKQWNEKPEAVEVNLFNGQTMRLPCQWPGRGFQYEIEEVIHCLGAGKIESNLHSHADSLALIETLDKIRKETGICYPQDIEECPVNIS